MCFVVTNITSCIGGTVVLYNKFDADSSCPSEKDNSRRPNAAVFNCVVAEPATGQWKVARCGDRHSVVCQSNHNTLPGNALAAYRVLIKFLPVRYRYENKS